MSAVVLFFLVFFPLFAGKNFLPFLSYRPYNFLSEKTSDCQVEKDKLLEVTLNTREYGIREVDFSGISIHYPMEYLIAKNIGRGIIPLWDPYIGCGIPTFGEGQFKPFNPFLLHLFFLQMPIFIVFVCFMNFCWDLFLW